MEKRPLNHSYSSTSLYFSIWCVTILFVHLIYVQRRYMTFGTLVPRWRISHSLLLPRVVFIVFRSRTVSLPRPSLSSYLFPSHPYTLSRQHRSCLLLVSPSPPPLHDLNPRLLSSTSLGSGPTPGTVRDLYWWKFLVYQLLNLSYI